MRLKLSAFFLLLFALTLSSWPRPSFAGPPWYGTCSASVSDPEYCQLGVGETVVVEAFIRDAFGGGISGIHPSNVVLVCSVGPLGVEADAPTDSDGRTTLTVSASVLEDSGCCQDLWVQAYYSGYVVVPVIGEVQPEYVDPLLSVENLVSEPFTEFGSALALGSSEFAIGERTHDGAVGNEGRVWLYDRSSGAVIDSLSFPSSLGGEELGSSVALTLDAIIAGAPGADPGGVDNAGSVLVWDLTTRTVRHHWPNPSSDANDRFGSSLATRGTDVIIGAPGNGGSVRVFDGIGGGELLDLTNPGPGGGFGRAVAEVDGNIVVGNPEGDGGAGTISVFDGVTGALLHQLPNPTGMNDGFGSVLAAGDGRIIAGAPEATWNGLLLVGVAHVFDVTTGDLLFSIANPGAPRMSHFGTGVAMSGDRFVVSAPFDDLQGLPLAGSTYVFEPSGALFRTLHPTGLVFQELFGLSVATDASGMLIGTRREHDVRRVYLFGDPATGVPSLPTKKVWLLLSARPTPFRSSTTIEFMLPEEAGQVRISIFDVAGRRLRDLAEGPRSAGRHFVVWDGRDREHVLVPPGVYFARLGVGNAVVTRKVVRVD